MNEQQCLAKMVPPSQRRRNCLHGGVMQIWLTRACDNACYGCTQASNIKGHAGFISLRQFDRACQSLDGYFGTVGIFGGNPCLHPQFTQICEILAEYVPFRRRGLWANRLMGHGAICRKTFNPTASNLNVHLNQMSYEEIRRDWPEARPFGLKGDSRHSPPYVAMQDILPDESERWKLISECDINQKWSAMICVVRGQLRGFFCEIAGAQAILHREDLDYPDHGIDIEPGWWQKPMSEYADQVRFHCHACGVPLRGYGELAKAENGIEYVSRTHVDVYVPKHAREVRLVTERCQLREQGVSSTVQYLQNAEK